MKEKLALFCNVDLNCVIENKDADSLYEIPLLLERENLAEIVCKKMNITARQPVDVSEWESIVEKQKKIEKTVTIGLVGKYVQLYDAYISIVESLKHSGIYYGSI